MFWNQFGDFFFTWTRILIRSLIHKNLRIRIRIWIQSIQIRNTALFWYKYGFFSRSSGLSHSKSGVTPKQTESWCGSVIARLGREPSLPAPMCKQVEFYDIDLPKWLFLQCFGSVSFWYGSDLKWRKYQLEFFSLNYWNILKSIFKVVSYHRKERFNRTCFVIRKFPGKIVLMC